MEWIPSGTHFNSRVCFIKHIVHMYAPQHATKVSFQFLLWKSFVHIHENKLWYLQASAEDVIAVQCGVWNAWGSGGRVDRTSPALRRGCQAEVPAPHAELHSACLMCVGYSDSQEPAQVRFSGSPYLVRGLLLRLTVFWCMCNGMYSHKPCAFMDINFFCLA